MVGSDCHNASMTTYVPLGMSREAYSGLYEGVPIWMARGLWNWIHEYLTGDFYNPSASIEMLALFDEQARMETESAEAFAFGGAEAVRRKWTDDETLVFVDWAVHGAKSRGRSAKLGPLEELLRRCGSAWKVGVRNGGEGLERRVPTGVQEAAEAVMATASHAGDILSEAWHAAFGINPDPSKAYDRALKAVEAAMKRPVSPGDESATLTKMRNIIRTQKNWTLALEREDPVTPNSLVLLGMIQALIAGQPDRHAADGPLPKVSPESAEVAVMLAVPLVQWFSSGAAARR